MADLIETETLIEDDEFRGPAAALALATHNGVWTIVSKATGEHRTFRVNSWTPEPGKKPKRVLSMLTGPDYWTGFAFVDSLPSDERKIRVSVWRRQQGGQYDKLARFLERLLDHLAAERVTVMASVRCRRCNRPLTNPESIQSGIGPHCEKAEGS